MEHPLKAGVADTPLVTFDLPSTFETFRPKGLTFQSPLFCVCVPPSLHTVNIFLLCSDKTEPKICTMGELDLHEQRLWENVYRAALTDLPDNATFSIFFSINASGLEMIANKTYCGGLF